MTFQTEPRFGFSIEVGLERSFAFKDLVFAIATGVEQVVID